METVHTQATIMRYREDFRRIGDLVNFEGPELSLFEHLPTRAIFLFDFAEHDATHNRWLLYEVEAKEVLKFVFGKTTHLQLYEKAKDGIVYCLDIENKLGFFNLPVLKLLEVPEGYLPQEVYFEESDCPNLKAITLYLQDRITSEKHENRCFQNVPRASLFVSAMAFKANANKLQGIKSLNHTNLRPIQCSLKKLLKELQHPSTYNALPQGNPMPVHRFHFIEKNHVRT